MSLKKRLAANLEREEVRMPTKRQSMIQYEPGENGEQRMLPDPIVKAIAAISIAAYPGWAWASLPLVSKGWNELVVSLKGDFSQLTLKGQPKRDRFLIGDMSHNVLNITRMLQLHRRFEAHIALDTVDRNGLSLDRPSNEIINEFRAYFIIVVDQFRWSNKMPSALTPLLKQMATYFENVPVMSNMALIHEWRTTLEVILNVLRTLKWDEQSEVKAFVDAAKTLLLRMKQSSELQMGEFNVDEVELPSLSGNRSNPSSSVVTLPMLGIVIEEDEEELGDIPEELTQEEEAEGKGDTIEEALKRDSEVLHVRLDSQIRDQMQRDKEHLANAFLHPGKAVSRGQAG